MKIRTNTIITSLIICMGMFSLCAEEAEIPSLAGSIRPHHHLSKTDLPYLAKIEMKTALLSAIEAVPGSVIQAELEVEYGVLLYSFLIVDKHQILVEVEVDAGNAKVLATEIEKDNKNEEHGEEDDDEHEDND